MTRLIAGRALARTFAALIGAWLISCEPYRIEHRKVPGFYYKAASGGIPDQVVLDDGTVIVNEPLDPNEARFAKTDASGKPFQLRKENEDGSVTLRAILPEHVLAHTIQCLQDESYQPYYDQMLSAQAKASWEEGTDEASGGFEKFQEYFRHNRRDLLVTLNRMFSGLSTQDVAVESDGQGTMRVRLRPQVARGFRYTELYMVNEGGELRLLGLR